MIWIFFVIKEDNTFYIPNNVPVINFSRFLPLCFISLAMASHVNQQETSLINPRHFTIQVKWGMELKTIQKWDGRVDIINGVLVKVTPFIRHSMIDDSKLITSNSWSSTTYTSTEGVFIHFNGSLKTKLAFTTLSGDFNFVIDTLQNKGKLDLLNNHVEIVDISDKYNYRIKGLEYGLYGDGEASIKPQSATVDSYGTWEIQYICGENGIKKDGGIRISWHFTKDWGDPQFTNPKAPNFVTINHSQNSKLSLGKDHQGFFEYPFTNGRIVIIADEDLDEGSTITVTLGDTTRGSLGFQTATIADSSFEFRVESCSEYQNDGFLIYRRIKNNPILNIVSKKKMNNIFIVAPTLSKTNHFFSAKFRIEDAFRNEVSNNLNNFQLFFCKENQKQFIGNYSFSGKNEHVLKIDSLKLSEAGIWRIEMKRDGQLLGQSNPIYITSQTIDKKIYWGELHGHTKYSDGYGEPIEYFNHARNNAFLDFAFITDHDVELDAPDYTVDQMYTINKETVKQVTNNENFISAWSWEWSPNRTTNTSKYPYGDHNIYFFCDTTNIFPSGASNSQTISQLYNQLSNHKQKEKIHIIPHVGGAISNWEYHNPYFETLAEIYSVHGSFENFGQLALDKGYHVGFVSASDSHSGQVGGFNPGISANHFVNGGLTAIITNNLSKESLSKAMKERTVYATTGKRIFIDFKINTAVMGSIIKSQTAPIVEAIVAGEKQIRKIDLIKNGQIIHTEHNRIKDDSTLHILWKNEIDKSDLTNFNEGSWSRRLRSVNWSGSLESESIELIDVYSFEINKDRILENNNNIKWSSDTRGDYDGISIKVDNKNTGILLTVNSNDFKSIAGPKGIIREQTSTKKLENFQFSYNSVPETGLELKINDNDTDKILIYKGTPLAYELSMEYIDSGLLYHENYYYLRVTQVDGNMAWSSPIWVQYD